MKKTMLILSFIVAAYIPNAQVLYGTTSGGGTNNYGTICKLVTRTNTLTTAFSFGAQDGRYPAYSKLLQASDGKLYGLAAGGGTGGTYGDGVIFSYCPATSTYTILHDFDYPTGAGPLGDLIQASDGQLYGMTVRGGINGVGVIFSLDPATSAYTKLMDFDGAKGANPCGSLVQASDGKLYGMTSSGGIYDSSFQHSGIRSLEFT